MKQLLFFISILFLGTVFLFPNSAFLQEDTTDENTNEMITMEKCGGSITLSEKMQERFFIDEIVPDKLNGITLPKTLELISPLCLIDVSEKISYDTTQGIQITYQDIPLKKHTSFFYWDGNQKKWFALPSIQREGIISTQYYQHFGIIGVFHDLTESREGIASWYRHSKTPQGAATNYFPLGTKVRVTNLENNKSIIVTITSTWTQKNPQRVIDIERTGFKKIGLISQGILRVRLEKLSETEIQALKPNKKK